VTGYFPYLKRFVFPGFGKVQ